MFGSGKQMLTKKGNEHIGKKNISGIKECFVQRFSNIYLHSSLSAPVSNSSISNYIYTVLGKLL